MASLVHYGTTPGFARCGAILRNPSLTTTVRERVECSRCLACLAAVDRGGAPLSPEDRAAALRASRRRQNGKARTKARKAAWMRKRRADAAFRLQERERENAARKAARERAKATRAFLPVPVEVWAALGVGGWEEGV